GDKPGGHCGYLSRAGWRGVIAWSSHANEPAGPPLGEEDRLVPSNDSAWNASPIPGVRPSQGRGPGARARFHLPRIPSSTRQSRSRGAELKQIPPGSEVLLPRQDQADPLGQSDDVRLCTLASPQERPHAEVHGRVERLTRLTVEHGLYDQQGPVGGHRLGTVLQEGGDLV